ncbi:hypothetical protein DAI22_09g152800 [Oryza sativa Japonica Group]|nr:hypothetical protein DAI22_09g152800 [Oryza sativa Japonica Group]
MSTAVADVPPAAAYGFPGSAKRGKPEEVVVLMGKRRNEGFFIEEEEEEEEVLTESSSIGAPSPASSSIGENSGEEEGGDDEEEVESKLKAEDEQVGLGCLDALEESLPIKRGLSNFYAGKSKSFTSLAEGDEGEEEDDDSDDDERQHRGKNGGRRESAAPPLPLPPPRLTLHTQMGGMVRRNGTFRSPRSLSLSDLQNSGGSC